MGYTIDGNGNITALVNGATGAIAAAYEYDPFGQPLRTDMQDSTVADQPFRFSTKFTDVETGLVYYGHRYYAPNLGRFVNRDPIEEAGGINLYAFCGNDGINRWDFLGNDPQYVQDINGNWILDPASSIVDEPVPVQGDVQMNQIVTTPETGPILIQQQVTTADGQTINQGYSVLPPTDPTPMPPDVDTSGVPNPSVDTSSVSGNGNDSSSSSAIATTTSPGMGVGSGSNFGTLIGMFAAPAPLVATLEAADPAVTITTVITNIAVNAIIAIAVYDSLAPQGSSTTGSAPGLIQIPNSTGNTPPGPALPTRWSINPNANAAGAAMGSRPNNPGAPLTPEMISGLNQNIADAQKTLALAQQGLNVAGNQISPAAAARAIQAMQNRINLITNVLNSGVQAPRKGSTVQPNTQPNIQQPHTNQGTGP